MSQSYGRKIREIWHLVFRNVFLLVNLIIFAVVGLLFFFGDFKEGLFLGIIIFVSMIVGTAKDIQAWLALEKLNFLTAARVVRVNQDGTEEQVLPEEIQKEDSIKLALGDQIPCDGLLVSVSGLEVNEALITGESRSFSKTEGEMVLAGSIVTSGGGLMRARTTYEESRIAQMTAGIQNYSANPSPIQRSIKTVVRYAGYVLAVVIAFVIVRGLVVGELPTLVVKNIGALTSMLVPQGLVLATALLFAYGALHSFKRHVLLQEIGATEKLGRIKNLCMDKTGTLTENTLAVESMQVSGGVSREDAEKLVVVYVGKLGDSSETILAIEKFLNRKYNGEAGETLPFSSWRRYGGVVVKDGHFGSVTVLAGAPEAFFPYLADNSEKQWLEELVETRAAAGKRVVCFVRLKGTVLPRELPGAELSVLAVFVLHNNLREGTREAISFFQARGVRIRIISGDNPGTARVVAFSAGVNDTEAIITGAEMEKWNEDDFRQKTRQYTIFARIQPEQKEKIVEALKKGGFTAMVGDGANDALAIKKADLGIAMFDGAPATRRLAAVVLTTNSFSELPSGVKLADNIIENTEIFASIFFNQTFLGFFLFVILSILGYAYPFAPLNITLINYFTIGMPGLLILYWAIHPREKVNPASAKPFLKRVISFPLISSIPQALGIAAVFVWELSRSEGSAPNSLAVLTFMAFGFIFFLFAAGAYSGVVVRKRREQLFWLAVFEFFLLFVGFRIAFLTEFFGVVPPPLTSVIQILLVASAYACVQYLLTRFYGRKRVG